MSNRLGITSVLLCVAIFAGGIIVAVEGVVFAMLTGHALKLSDDWLGPVTSAPFLVLALLSVTERAPWAIALVLTLLIWGGWLYGSSVQHPDGAVISISEQMLFGAPVLISVAAAVVHFWIKRSHPPG